MDDHEILGRVSELVKEEHELRSRLQQGELAAEDEREQLRRLEGALDQCWDLLRQRRAAQEAGQDPESAQVRPLGEVENYLQ